MHVCQCVREHRSDVTLHTPSGGGRLSERKGMKICWANCHYHPSHDINVVIAAAANLIQQELMGVAARCLTS